MVKVIIFEMNKIRIDFHCHSMYSKDSLSNPQDLVKAARRRGLSRLVVSDHNSIRGGVAAKKLAPDLIIVGEEIMTTKGEILASFVQEEIPAGLHPLKVISLLKEQGAFISISHPFDKHRNGHWKSEDLLDLLPYIDAIEGFNARCVNPNFNQLAMDFAKQHKLAMTVGSDAHSIFEVGKAYLEIEDFDSADGLRSVIAAAVMHNSLSSPAVHLTSRWAVLVKKIWRNYPN